MDDSAPKYSGQNPEIPDDPETERAVDEIMKLDGDEALQAQDKAAEKALPIKLTRRERFKRGWKHWWASPRKKWGSIAVIVIVIGALFAVPVTRYSILGVVLKTDVTVQVRDTKTGAPVSGVTVKLSGQGAETGATGKATLHVKLGRGTLKVSKSYYESTVSHELVGFGSAMYKASLKALGRQVKIKVVNGITTKPVSGATLQVGKTNAQTDASGIATVVVASDISKPEAVIHMDGYNDVRVHLDIVASVPKNTFTIVPVGKVYFVDDGNNIVSTNLDGTDRKVIYRNSTAATVGLRVSPDNKYLAYFVNGSSPAAILNLVDTANTGKVVTIDSVADGGSFALNGWNGDTLVYEANTPSAYQLKSFDAASSRPLLLDKIDVTADEPRIFSDVYVFGSQVVYAKSWTMATDENTNKHDELHAIRADGTNPTVLQTFVVAYGHGLPHLATAQYAPGALYIYDGTSYYAYTGGKVSPANISSDDFSSASHTSFIASPSGNKVLWMNPQKVLIVSNADGTSQKQLPLSASYVPYGWADEQYLLLRNGSNVYVVPVSGGAPYKVPGVSF